MPGDSIKAQLRYKVKIPKDKYTRFGVDNKGNYHIKYWWITPAAFDQSWVVYSNKNLDDFSHVGINSHANVVSKMANNKIERCLPKE